MSNLAPGTPVIFRCVEGTTSDGKEKIGRLMQATLLGYDKDPSGTYAELRFTESGAVTRVNPSYVHTPDEHVGLLVAHPSNPWFRTESTCGHKGVWLNDYKKCLPCPHSRTIVRR